LIEPQQITSFVTGFIDDAALVLQK
jgi:hypothetical protein